MTLSLPTFNQTSALLAHNLNDTQHNSRKRQRSHSMQSNASSPKRSLSEDPFQDNPMDNSQRDNSTVRVLNSSDLSSNTTLPDVDMSTQDDPIIHHSQPLLASLDPSTIDSLLIRPLQIGESWYIISKRWLDRWRKACTGQTDKEDGVILESELGPPDKDNNAFVDENNHLLTSISTEEVELVPQEVWDHFISRYGGPTLPLPRKVVPRGLSMGPSIEMHPLLLRVVRLVEQSESEHGPAIPPVEISVGDTLTQLSHALAAPFNKQGTTRRIWYDVLPTEWTLYPRAKLIEDRARLLEESEDSVEKELIQTGDAFAVEFQDEDGNWLVDADRIGSRAIVPAGDPCIPPPLFGPGNDFFLSMQSSTSSSAQGTSALNKTSAVTKSWKSSAPVASSSKRNQEPGTLGLGNMGNTCFMNSALQCLAHTKELCQYFISGVFESELNPDNPLGMHGAIAETFGSLLRRIWSTTSTSTSYSPREFKQQLQRFAPQFIGYQQHDSQELVAFLLDGLHEDLNRILMKPYVEKADWEGGGDKELVELAIKSWDGYLKRNDSVIVDLFQGQYKSTLVCPECEKVSITFDPFMYLTLPLPIQKKWGHTIYYVPWRTDKAMLRIPVETSRDATFKDLRKLLGRWLNTSANNLLTAEVFQHRFYKNLDDGVLCSETADTDIIVCFELPCNSQQSRWYKRQPNDPFIVPVFINEGSHTRPTYGRGTSSYFGYPMVVVIDQETATDKNAIYDAVVERMEQWVRNPRDLYTWEGGSPSSSDSMMEEVPIPIAGLPTLDTVTEITPNGEVLTIQEAPEEGDITDEKDIIVSEEEPQVEVEMKRLGPKPEIFTLRIQNTGTPFSSGFTNPSRYESWEKREQAASPGDDDGPRGPLLREGDALICEFDEHMKNFYFPDLPTLENALWQVGQDFFHPEYVESKKAETARRNKDITLQDCLDEFTKEEKLGEDDLWYCPRCKKHQQATKRFDLWKVPDILVVHLKRFSNSRTLRDKIDTLVEFPIEGLDLEAMVGERQVANSLMQQGVDIVSMGLGDVEEPLVYDLYAVDEHLGGLGGGHYRAYALNHVTNLWYHFDDSYVTQTRAEDAVNPNAYLLFYRRRTSRPLGGKTHDKIETAGVNVNGDWLGTDAAENRPAYTSLTSSPNLPGLCELPASPDLNPRQSGSKQMLPFMNAISKMQEDPVRHSWSPPSDTSSPAPLEDSALDDEPPTFEDSHLDPLLISSTRFDFPDPNCSKESPTSSNEAISGNVVLQPNDDWPLRQLWDPNESVNKLSDSPPGSTSEEDVYEDQIEPKVVHIPVEESTLNEIDL